MKQEPTMIQQVGDRGNSYWSEKDNAFTIAANPMSDRCQLVKEPFVVASRGREPQCLTPKRTEYGKAIRKKYEAHEVTEQRKNIQKLEPRTDGVTNTLKSVQKDNLLCMPQCQRNMQTIIGSKQANAARANLNQVSPTLTEAMGMGGGQIPMLTDATIEETKSEQFMSQMRKPKDNMLCEPSFRIRKLTERECFRLMGCDEQTIDKIQASGVSRSQQYKLAGNSIVVDVLTAIFDKMFVHTEITELKLFY